MVLESTMICADTSDYMRNGDFIPSRLYAQQDAVNIICRSKIRSNPENNFGLLTLAKVKVLATLGNDVGHIMIKLYNIQPNGDIDLPTGLKIAHLALKHREGKNHKMRIVAFVGSPVFSEEEELVTIAKKLRKEKVSVDVINFGEEIFNLEILTSFVNNINGKEGTGSHLLTISSGVVLSDVLISSPIVHGVDGTGAIRLESIENDQDPELAMALLISMQEYRQIEEEETRRANKPTISSKEAEPETILPKERIIRLNEVNFENMSEEDQLLYALRMSMQTIEDVSSTRADPTENEQNQAMDDPAILQSILESLPGVDPDSDVVRQAVEDAKKKKKEDEANKEAKE